MIKMFIIQFNHVLHTFDSIQFRLNWCHKRSSSKQNYCHNPAVKVTVFWEASHLTQNPLVLSIKLICCNTSSQFHIWYPHTNIAHDGSNKFIKANRWRSHWDFLNTALYVLIELHLCSEAIPIKLTAEVSQCSPYNFSAVSHSPENFFLKKIIPIAPILHLLTLNCNFIFLFSAFFCSRPIPYIYKWMS